MLCFVVLRSWMEYRRRWFHSVARHRSMAMLAAAWPGPGAARHCVALLLRCLACAALGCADVGAVLAAEPRGVGGARRRRPTAHKAHKLRLTLGRTLGCTATRYSHASPPGSPARPAVARPQPRRGSPPSPLPPCAEACHRPGRETAIDAPVRRAASIPRRGGRASRRGSFPQGLIANESKGFIFHLAPHPRQSTINKRAPSPRRVAGDNSPLRASPQTKQQVDLVILSSASYHHRRAPLHLPHARHSIDRPLPSLGPRPDHNPRPRPPAPRAFRILLQSRAAHSVPQRPSSHSLGPPSATRHGIDPPTSADSRCDCFVHDDINALEDKAVSHSRPTPTLPRRPRHHRPLRHTRISPLRAGLSRTRKPAYSRPIPHLVAFDGA